MYINIYIPCVRPRVYMQVCDLLGAYGSLDIHKVFITICEVIRRLNACRKKWPN